MLQPLYPRGKQPLTHTVKASALDVMRNKESKGSQPRFRAQPSVMRLRRRNVSGIKNQSDNVILTLAGLVSLLEPNDRFPRYWTRVLTDITRLHKQPFTAASMTFIPERQRVQFETNAT